MLQIVRNLAIFNGIVIVLMGIFAYSHSLPRGEIISLLLTSVLAAIPVVYRQRLRLLPQSARGR